jgi:beta-mannosidase
VFSEWRAPGSEMRRRLVWFYRDLWPGAGWGITDSARAPKAAYWYLSARMAAVNGAPHRRRGSMASRIHVVNDGAETLDADVELELLQAAACRAAPRRHRAGAGARRVDARGRCARRLLHRRTNAYRFGPPKFDVVVARFAPGARVLAEDSSFPSGIDAAVQGGAALDARVTAKKQGHVLTLRSDTFLQAVRPGGAGPRARRQTTSTSRPRRRARSTFRRREGARDFEVRIEALNLAG